LAACGDAGEPGPEQQEPSNADLLIESVTPEDGAMVAQNRTVTVTFYHPVLPDTLAVAVDGEVVRLATVDDREFRFVPLTLHEPDRAVEIRVHAGVEDATGQILDRDFAWSFATEPDALAQPSALSDAEIALITAGESSTPLDLVTDYDDPASSLYDISPPIDPQSPHLTLLIDRMLTSVVHHGGIGLAAPQVGINRRVFVAEVDASFRAFVNPNLLAWSETWREMVEGCLSVPDQDASVSRPDWIEFSYHTADGALVDLEQLADAGASAIPARLWLHEFDHLNGILLLDRAGTADPN
jgi:peptide deformylase